MSQEKQNASGTAGNLRATVDGLIDYPKYSTAAPKYQDQQLLDITQVHPNPNQPRKFFDPVALQELADSIKEKGLISPISVRPVDDNCLDYIIVAGERRWRACKLAGLDTIRAEILEADENEAFTLSVIENEQREDLSPIETAQSLKTMMDSENLTQFAVARRIGKSRDWVAQKIRLLNLPNDTQNAIANNGLTEAHGRQLLKLNGAGKGDKITSLAEQATTEKWSVSRLESEVNSVINENVSQDTLQVMVVGDGKRLTLTGDKARSVIDYAESLLSDVSQDTQGGVR